MYFSPADLAVIQSEERVEKLKRDRDAALATPGQETRAADLNELLMQEERLLDQHRQLAKPKKGPDPRLGSLEEDASALPPRE